MKIKDYDQIIKYRKVWEKLATISIWFGTREVRWCDRRLGICECCQN